MLFSPQFLARPTASAIDVKFEERLVVSFFPFSGFSSDADSRHCPSYRSNNNNSNNNDNNNIFCFHQSINSDNNEYVISLLQMPFYIYAVLALSRPHFSA